MRTIWSFQSAGRIVFGAHAAGQTGEIARSQGATRALLITDPVLLGAGLADPIRDSLETAGVAVTLYDGGEPEPTIRAALECRALAAETQPDVVIGLGGGSNMDLAKIVAVLMAHGGHPGDYMGDSKIPGPIAPLIAISTTAGTGSEVSAATVLKDTDRNVKFGVLSNYLRPLVAIVDPLLTLSCPPSVTADSGIDALTHAIEAYTAVDNETFPLPPGEVTIYQGRHPLGEYLAEKAIHLVGQHLPTAVKEGSNLAAREGMHLASLLAGLAFGNIGVALVHALEFPIGTAAHCPHGRGNGLLLPYVMEFNKPERIETMGRIAEILGADTRGKTPEAAADAAIEAVRNLRREVGIPERLRDIGVREEQLRGFAEASSAFQRLLRVNPRQATVDDIEQILRAAY